jgi:succinate dehydrogenase / fumarate reductase flavoprotein subunit
MQRRESRGAHQRYDYPNLDPMLNVNFVTCLDKQGDIHVISKPLTEISIELAEWVRKEKEQLLQGRLLD